MKWSWLFALLAGAGAAQASTNAPAPAVGSPAPDFSAVDSASRTNRLADFRGQWLVLYFYPRAFTPGCTREACSLRDGYAGFRDLKAVVLGVSLDPVARLKEFRARYSLPFELLSDADKSMARAYDSLGAGGLFAKRRTFVIDPQGRVAHVFDAVDVQRHDAEVKAVLEKLQSESKPPAS
jgi:thioredoxin-dependent peroxiredoxin